MNILVGLVKVTALEIICLGAWVYGAKERRRIRASWALYFGATSFGGVDDGFLEELARLLDGDPDLQRRVAEHIKGEGWVAVHQRMILETFSRNQQ